MFCGRETEPDTFARHMLAAAVSSAAVAGSVSLQARPTTLNQGQASWVHAVQTTDVADTLEVYVPSNRKIITPAGVARVDRTR